MIPLAVALAFLAGVVVGVYGTAAVLLTVGAAGRGAGGRDA